MTKPLDLHSIITLTNQTLSEMKKFVKIPFCNSTLTKKFYLTQLDSQTSDAQNCPEKQIHKKSGICYVFNNNKFKNSESIRCGTEFDSEALKMLFENSFEFKYKKFEDSTKYDTEGILMDGMYKKSQNKMLLYQKIIIYFS